MCTADDRPLSNSVAATIAGPVVQWILVQKEGDNGGIYGAITGVSVLLAMNYARYVVVST